MKCPIWHMTSMRKRGTFSFQTGLSGKKRAHRDHRVDQCCGSGSSRIRTFLVGSGSEAIEIDIFLPFIVLKSGMDNHLNLHVR
jgi:hypothetical protein